MTQPEDTFGLKENRNGLDEAVLKELSWIRDTLDRTDIRLVDLEKKMKKLWEESYANPKNDLFASPPRLPKFWICRYCKTVMGYGAKHCNTCGEPKGCC